VTRSVPATLAIIPVKDHGGDGGWKRERRRHPRVRVEEMSATVPATLNVQVLDISASGALFRTTRPIAPGMRGVFRLDLGGRQLSAEVMVRRVAPIPGGVLGFHVGVTFESISRGDLALIERFIEQ